MAQKVAKKNGSTTGSGSLGFEETLWQSADQLRGNMDAAVYKHIVLGLIFLKYIFGAFEQRHAELLAEDPDLVEDEDEYRSEGVFWVPVEARWSFVQARLHRTGPGTGCSPFPRTVSKQAGNTSHRTP